MTHDELLAEIDSYAYNYKPKSALRAVVELHNARGGWIFQGVLQDQFCGICDVEYPCPTIQAITDNLK